MIELKGKYNECKIFTDEIDNATRGQITALLDQESMKNTKIRIMPDCHAGAGCVIGTTMAIKDKLIPNLVGVDIGCGMYAIKLKEKRIDLPKLDSTIRKYIPFGFNIITKAQYFNIYNIKAQYFDIYNIKAPINIDNALISIGTLGGGNHFIEIDRDSDNYLWLVIHTGSRHTGLEVCNYYQNLAYENLKDNKDLRNQLIEKLKSEGREKEISSALKEFSKENSTHIPKMLAYCEGNLFNDYIHDMRIMQDYADTNRRTIAKIIMKRMKLHPIHEIMTRHNYIDIDNMILRKGSISAQKDEEVIIPMNMRDGSLICKGKGNPDWNYSAPHGAGRLMSRTEAKESISMNDYKKSMNGIYSSCISKETIDESAFAYKPMQSIIDNIKDTVEIIDIIKPIYNFKAEE